jgi:hypothetical protein
MAVEIINFPFGGNDDKCLVLSNAQWAATGIGSGWRTIRIGIRYCLEDLGTPIPGYLRFFLGVMSNPTVDANGQLSNGYLSAVRGHMLGIIDLNDLNLARAVSSTYNVVSFDGNHYARVVAGGSGTNSTYSGGRYFHAAKTAFGASRFAMIIQIHKSVVASSYTAFVTEYHAQYDATDSGTPRGTLSLSAFLQAMVAEYPYSALQALEGGSYWYYSYNGLAVNESANGPLNAIHVSWGKVTPRIAISDICYAILA